MTDASEDGGTFHYTTLRCQATLGVVPGYTDDWPQDYEGYEAHALTRIATAWQAFAGAQHEAEGIYVPAVFSLGRVTYPGAPAEGELVTKIETTFNPFYAEDGETVEQLMGAFSFVLDACRRALGQVTAQATFDTVPMLYMRGPLPEGG